MVLSVMAGRRRARLDAGDRKHATGGCPEWGIRRAGAQRSKDLDTERGNVGLTALTGARDGRSEGTEQTRRKCVARGGVPSGTTASTRMRIGARFGRDLWIQNQTRQA